MADSKGITGRRQNYGLRLGTGLLFIAVMGGLYLYARNGPLVASWFSGRVIEGEEKLGPWGDSFGAVNVVISSLAFLGIVSTLWLQRRVSAEQTDDQHRQRFDASFFQLVSILRETRSQLSFVNTREFEAGRADGSYVPISPSAINRLPIESALNPVSAAVLEVHFQLVRAGIMRTCTKDQLIYAYMHHVHSASEATIAPFFRLIYAILDRLRHDEVLTPDEKVRYANIVRAQLTSAEVLLLGINSLTPVSADMQSLVTEFRMLKYLPRSSMRNLLRRLHHPAAFLGRDDDPIPRTEPKATAFEDQRYKRMIKALHAERISRRWSRKRLSEQLGKPESYVAKYEEGRIMLSVADFANVAEALGRHPAAMLRD